MTLPADLPDELWTLIIGRLEDPAALSKTSRALNALVNEQAKQCLDHLKAPASLLSDHVIRIESTGGGSSLSQLGRLYLSLKREGYDLEKECRSLDPQKILSSYHQKMQDQALVTIFPKILEAANSPPLPAPITAEECRRWLRENSALLQRIRSLDLSNLNLKIVPSEIGSLIALQWLYLKNNQLTSLPPEIDNLISLQALDLSNNWLISLSSGIGKLIALQALNLSQNRLNQLPPEIGSLTALYWLELSNNQLNQLPPGIGSLTALRWLYLQSNPSLRRDPALERQLGSCRFHW